MNLGTDLCLKRLLPYSKMVVQCSRAQTFPCPKSYSFFLHHCDSLKNTTQLLAPCKGIQDSLGFWIPDSLSKELGFRIPMVSAIPVSLSCIMDSKIQDSTFHRIKFRKFQIPEPNILRIPESGFTSYLGKSYVRYRDARSLTLDSRGYFFLIDTDVCRVNEAPREKKSPSRGPYQTVSRVYFILGILRTDFWSQGYVASQYHM